MTAQLALALGDDGHPSDGTIEDAAARGVLRLEVDDERPLHRLNGSAIVGGERVDADEPIRVVHVISTYAGGEVRGYVLARGRLHLRLPCYTGRWAEMDAWVAAQLGATVVPYELGPGAGGMEARW